MVVGDCNYARAVMSAVSVIDLRSLSYTGTTWINLLVGCHPSVFTLGPPQRAYAALDGDLDAAKVCRAHGKACSFWPSLIESWHCDSESQVNGLYSHIARQSSSTHVVTNNPFVDPRGLADLQAEAVEIFQFSVVRDVRALVCSHKARHETSVTESAQWVARHASLVPEDVRLRLTYEDVRGQPSRALSAIGAHIGLDYSPDAHRFWEFEHHPVGGNSGPVGQLRSGQPQRVSSPSNWSEQLSTDDLKTIQRIAGHVHEAWGYSW